ncbi:MAG: DUF4282 domain-containing protein [Phycisphaerales bacterium]
MDSPFSGTPGQQQSTGLGALLDFGFNHFVTLKVIKVLYALGLCLIVLVWLGAIGSALLSKNIPGVLGAVVIGGGAALVYAIFFRIWLEIIVVVFRIGENTSRLVRLQGGSPTSPDRTT